MFNNLFFFSKIVPFMRQCENVVQPDKPFALHLICLRVQAHTQNMKYLLIFDWNNGCTKSPQCYFICTLSVLFNYREYLSPLSEINKLIITKSSFKYYLVTILIKIQDTLTLEWCINWCIYTYVPTIGEDRLRKEVKETVTPQGKIVFLRDEHRGHVLMVEPSLRPNKFSLFFNI